jgi:hypothetical protein
MLSDPEPHGRAALMLCESILLLLIDRRVISRDDANDAIGGLIEVERERAEMSDHVVVSLASVNLLQAILRSLSAAPAPPCLVIATTAANT